MAEQDPFQQQDPFQDPFSPPQTQQSIGNQQGGHIGYGNTDVQASINREKSIVVKTLPDSVMHEFSDANTERLGRMSLGNPGTSGGDPFNPFASDTQTGSEDPFAPPEQQPAPVRQAAPPPPQPVQQQAPQQVQQQSVPAVDPEAQRLVDVIKSCLTQELASGSRTPMTVGILSAKIKTNTGKSWGGHWQSSFGPLTGFLKKHPQFFTLVRNKYVVLVGREGDTDIPLDNPVKPAPAKTDVKVQAPKTTTPAVKPSFNPILPPSQPNMMFQQQPAMFPNMAMQGNSFNINPMMGGQPQMQTMGMYGQPQLQQQQQFQFQQSQMGFPVQQMAQTAPTQQFQQQQFAPPQQLPQQQAPLATSSGTTGSFDPFAQQPPQQQQGNANWWQPDESANKPVAGWDDTALGDFSSDEPKKKEDEKQRRKLERERKKQEEKDAEFARKLQEEENARAGAPIESFTESTSAAGKPSYVTLAAPEIRKLAEKEIGPENIKILSGFSVKKYGREGRPHQRKMWVTSGLTHLAWESSQFDGSHRGVELQKVTEILVGRITPTIERSTKDRKKVQSLCFSLVTQSRTVDLQACSVIQRDTLVDAMRKVIEFNHKHKPVRIDRNRTKILVDAA